MMERWVLAPPAPRGLIQPWATDRPEHVAAHDRGADVRQALFRHRGAGVDVASRVAMHLPKGLEREKPRVQIHAATAKRVLLVLVRACDVAVQRHRDAYSQAALSRSSVSHAPPNIMQV